MTKTIYNYDQQAGELLCASLADESPLEQDVYLIPAFATDIVPPKSGANQVAVFSGGKWSLNNVAAPVVPTAAQLLAQAQQVQSAVVNAACATAITEGFTSSALGAPHMYPAKQTDQQNLSASVLASMYPNLPAGWTTPFWCADANGVWAWINHTAVQIQQAGGDGKAAILGCMSKNAALQAQITAATDVPSVQKINWS